MPARSTPGEWSEQRFTEQEPHSGRNLAEVGLGERCGVRVYAKAGTGGAWVAVKLILSRAHRLEPLGERHRVAVVAPVEIRSQPVTGLHVASLHSIADRSATPAPPHLHRCFRGVSTDISIAVQTRPRRPANGAGGSRRRALRHPRADHSCSESLDPTPTRHLSPAATPRQSRRARQDRGADQGAAVTAIEIGVSRVGTREWLLPISAVVRHHRSRS